MKVSNPYRGVGGCNMFSPHSGDKNGHQKLYDFELFHQPSVVMFDSSL